MRFARTGAITSQEGEPREAKVTPDRVLSEGPPSGAIRYSLLVQYRAMAFTTAILLIILVFIGIPLQFAAHRPGVVNLVGTLHGFLYIVYLFVAFRVTRKLKFPLWKMALILLAGTVPFCAFVAERKVSRRFNAVTGTADHVGGSAKRARSGSNTLRKRWLSRRALLLHLEVAVVAPGCVIAGWWQATRALAGNSLSWIYSVEWPLFALLAIWGWWHLVHEDPEAYRLRRLRSVNADEGIAPEVLAGPADLTDAQASLDGTAARSARILASLICLEFVVGLVAVGFIPFNRASGWVPTRGEAIYLVHAIFGALLVCIATALLIRSRACTRAVKLSGRVGFTGLLFAAAGGLLTEGQSLIRFLGVTVMLVGALFSVFGYMIPTLHMASRARAARGMLSDVRDVHDLSPN